MKNLTFRGFMILSAVVSGMITLLAAPGYACFYVGWLLSLLWHNFFLFFITSALAAAVDAVFTLMRRYNRPRLVRLINKQNSRRITL